ncbi:hypothetical protein PIB30_099710 [Stylosanthes scabra]|uniref:Uncharacterized protein n=1 Tax=Stylosanthes scabra TaxID=79078 RepID=A0ABU6SXS5_9FABA|nr:hypothetical protein [Stylosanthes scabra]
MATGKLQFLLTALKTEIANLTATSSKDLLFKLRNLESNRLKVVRERQNYGMQEVSSASKEGLSAKEGNADLASKGKSKIVPKLSATQNNLKEGLVANKGMVKPVPKLTVMQSKLKEGELANKVLSKKGNQDEIATDNQQQLVAPQSNCKEAQHSPKKMKKPVLKRLDFSHLQSTFAAITRKVNTLPPTLADQQGIPAEQPGSSHSKDLGQGNMAVDRSKTFFFL